MVVVKKENRMEHFLLMALGMMMVSPAMISLPFKLMIFVMVDGWALLMGSLAQSFAT